MAISKGYTGDYHFGGDAWYIYVHKYPSHIGNANGKGKTSGQKLIEAYKGQKRQAAEAVQREYLNLLKNSVTISNMSKELINNLLENTDFVTELNRVLVENLDSSIDKAKAYAMMQQYENVNKDLTSRMFSSDSKIALHAFDELLDILSAATRLLEGDSKGIAEALLAEKGQIKNGRNMSLRMGSALQRAVSKIEKQANGKSINLQRAAAAASGINQLGERLITQKTSTGEDLTSSSFLKAIYQVFNTNFAESLGTFLRQKGRKPLFDLTGSDKYEISFTDEQGNIINDAALENTEAYGKADYKAKNYKLSFDFKKDHVDISMNLGGSVKFYKSQDFAPTTWAAPEILKNFSFSGGDAGSVAEVLHMLFGDSYTKYLAYNTVYYYKGTEDIARGISYKELKRLMALRAINRGFAARNQGKGKNDFAQFIYANGEIISLWEIIQTAIDNYDDWSSEDVVSVDWPDGELHSKVNQNGPNSERVRQINNNFKSTSVTIKLHADKLLKATGRI